MFNKQTHLSGDTAAAPVTGATLIERGSSPDIRNGDTSANSDFIASMKNSFPTSDTSKTHGSSPDIRSLQKSQTSTTFSTMQKPTLSNETKTLSASENLNRSNEHQN